jgi:hypothetical protein
MIDKSLKTVHLIGCDVALDHLGHLVGWYQLECAEIIHLLFDDSVNNLQILVVIIKSEK